MSLIDEALKRARLDAARQDAARQAGGGAGAGGPRGGFASPWTHMEQSRGRRRSEARRIAAVAAMALSLLVGVVGSVLFFRSSSRSSSRPSLGTSQPAGTGAERALAGGGYVAGNPDVRSAPAAPDASPASAAEATDSTPAAPGAERATAAARSSGAAPGAGEGGSPGPRGRQAAAAAPSGAATPSASATTLATLAGTGQSPASPRPSASPASPASPLSPISQASPAPPPGGGEAAGAPAADDSLAADADDDAVPVAGALGATASAPAPAAPQARNGAAATATAPAAPPARTGAAVRTMTDGGTYVGEVKLADGSSVKLSGIAWSDVSPVAMINGKLIGPGQGVDQVTVDKIEPGRVTLRDRSGALFYLRLN